jgi:Glycosyltransferase family 43
MDGDPNSSRDLSAMGMASSSHRALSRGAWSSRQDVQRLAIFLITVVGMLVCIGGSMMQVQYMYFLFDSSDGSWRGPTPEVVPLPVGLPVLVPVSLVASGSGGDDGSIADKGLRSATRRTPLPPRMTEQDVLHHAFHAMQKIPPLMQPIRAGTARETPIDDSEGEEEDPRHHILYLITPTHKRVTQMVDMTRASQTLQLAQLKYQMQFYWIVVEDSGKCTQRIRQLLLDSGIPFAHVAVPTVKTAEGHKGVDQRNKALNIIRQHAKEDRGIVYFLDDDNAYDVRIFPELLRTKVVSVGAVGLPSPSTYERCHVNQLNGTVDRLLSGWSVQARRPFGIDMAGFAFSTSLLADPKIQFAKDSEKGFLEHDFLKRLVDGKLDKLEPIGGNCTRILTWHVRTSVGMPGRQYKSPEVHGSGNSTLLMQLV